MIQDYFSFTFFIYLLRWIFSAFVMMIPLFLIQKTNLTSRFGKYKEYIDLILVQIFGAFVFFEIDKIIFN
jgi:ABC-type glycerol-3-phosphate transport system permease component